MKIFKNLVALSLVTNRTSESSTYRGNVLGAKSLRENCPSLYFPVLGLNVEIFSRFSPNTGKYGPEKTAYLGTFYAMNVKGNSI